MSKKRGRTLFSFGLVQVNKKPRRGSEGLTVEPPEKCKICGGTSKPAGQCELEHYTMLSSRPEKTGSTALQQALASSKAEERERESVNKTFRERLRQNLATLNMEVRTDVPPDGNCFYHCVVDQMRRLGIAEVPHAAQLRKDVFHFVSDLDTSDPLAPHITPSFLTATSQDGTWADHVTLQATARMLHRDIWIVTSQEKSTQDGYLLHKVKSGDSSCGEPFLLGHIGEYHYVSLEPISAQTPTVAVPGAPTGTKPPVSTSILLSSSASSQQSKMLSVVGPASPTPCTPPVPTDHADTTPVSTSCSQQSPTLAVDISPTPPVRPMASILSSPVSSQPSPTLAVTVPASPRSVPMPSVNAPILSSSASSQRPPIFATFTRPPCPTPSVPTSPVNSSAPSSPAPSMSQRLQQALLDDKACQPRDMIFPQTKDGAKMRRFQSTWYEQWSWLHYDVTSDRAFCFTCSKCHHLNLLPPNVNAEPTFTQTGFNKWKKATGTAKANSNKKGGKFSEHELSKYHRLAVQCLATQNVVTSMSTFHHKDQEEARSALLAIIDALRFLTRQGLPIRGHEEHKGNFKELLRLLGKESHALRKWIQRDGTRKRHWMSHDIQNEMIELMARKVINHILQDIKDSQWYALIIDETTDCSTSEQVSICVRYVKDLEPFEVFLGLYDTSSTTAETLFKIILDVLLRFQLDINKCRGQCYDGARNMSGCFNGVQAKVKEREDRALYVHCSNHCLNLAVQEGASAPFVRDALDVVNELGKMLKGSAKRKGLFKRVQSESESTPFKAIKPLCPTRWTVKASAIRAVIDQYDSILTTLDIISSENDTAATTARGLSQQLTKMVTYFALLVAYEIFSVTDELARVLQSAKMTVSGAQASATVVLQKIANARTDSNFTAQWKKAEEAAQKLDLVKPSLPRVRRPPRRHEDDRAAEAHSYTSVKDFFKRQYFEFLDTCNNTIQTRFDQPGFKVLTAVESLITSAATDSNVDDHELKKVCRFFGDDIDHQRLEHQLGVLSCLDQMSEVKNIGDVVRIFITLHDDTKRLLSEVKKLLHIYLTVPASAATAERSFSSLRRLKTWLRSTVGQARLNHIAVLHAHQEQVDTLVPTEIAEEFISRDPGRRSTFGRY